MPIGSFLDSFPSLVFVAAHVAFLALGLWAWRRTGRGRANVSPTFWLYVAAQAIFLGFFAGALTMKMAVLLEQMLMAAMVLLVATKEPVAA
jgi:hypothetical protein